MDFNTKKLLSAIKWGKNLGFGQRLYNNFEPLSCDPTCLLAFWLFIYSKSS
jgi:hypothetical protein